MYSVEGQDALSENSDEDEGEAMQQEKIPLQRQDVMLIFDTLRTSALANFDELLKLATTREERDTIGRKMEQLEREIELRLHPFQVKNKAESLKTLEKLDARVFANLEQGV